MNAPSSLLRPLLAATLGAAVLAFPAAAFTASPDPSPAGGYGPDPYPTRPAAPRAPAPAAPAAAHVVVVPRTTTVSVHAAAKTEPPPAARKVPSRRHATRSPVERTDDHRAAGFFALTAPTIASERSVSPVLASALGMFVLLSALFLVGATRAVLPK
jgi:hypothetical protein